MFEKLNYKKNYNEEDIKQMNVYASALMMITENGVINHKYEVNSAWIEDTLKAIVEEQSKAYIAYAWKEYAKLETVLNWLGWYYRKYSIKISELYFKYYWELKEAIDDEDENDPKVAEALKNYRELVD